VRTGASVARKSVSGAGAGVDVGDVAADPAPGAAVGAAVVTAASFCDEHAERAPRATTMLTSRGANIP
jgi:hypothetical protein